LERSDASEEDSSKAMESRISKEGSVHKHQLIKNKGLLAPGSWYMFIVRNYAAV